MPAALAAAERRREQQARLALAAQRQALHAWRQVPLSGLDAWDPQPFANFIAALQLTLAAEADSYVTAALDEQQIDPEPAGHVNAPALAAVAGDGRSLTTLFDQPRIQAKSAIGDGAPAQAAWDSAASTLQMMAVTAVQDASRVSVGVATVARMNVDGWIRMISPPSCSRCAILAGVWYRWNAGFDRHPNCDCVGVPAAENTSGDLRTDPAKAVRDGQVTGMSSAEIKAFNEGADLNQLVNVHRRGSVYTAGGRTFTKEGTTLRGAFGRQIGRSGATKREGERYRRVSVPRLTPEQIYREAGDDRSEAVRLLRRFGYLN